MNSLCEGGADKGAAFYYARHLFASCTHKLYAPDHPADAPPVPVCTRSDLCRGCPTQPMASSAGAPPGNACGLG